MIDRKALREEALEEARRVLGSAVEHRRAHPYQFYIFHLKMERSYERRGRRLPTAWHRFWRRRYWAKAAASNESEACMKAQAHEEGNKPS